MSINSREFFFNVVDDQSKRSLRVDKRKRQEEERDTADIDERLVTLKRRRVILREVFGMCDDLFEYNMRAVVNYKKWIDLLNANKMGDIQTDQAYRDFARNIQMPPSLTFTNYVPIINLLTNGEYRVPIETNVSGMPLTVMEYAIHKKDLHIDNENVQKVGTVMGRLYKKKYGILNPNRRRCESSGKTMNVFHHTEFGLLDKAFTECGY